ncbi:methyltransferase domain-containing protein [Aquimarina sp. 2201CG14-23]|uniref:methyltransferase domain-containing protein n=1 Tax=Aquimarina mycalae TaxID=3040073 RepID=UPI0024781D32|nr:methyltransferase domain-containing protein [Aquimarina sp. 2201CG14-23]MDH7445287.1 methyltransferase domain-containing protein [Aquimarina sp. 2201CG14-23]
MNFHTRIHTPEQLDNLSLSGNELQKTLLSLKLINFLFGNHRQLTKSVLEFCSTHPTKETFHIVDLGCGGGDSIHQISKKLQQKNIRASFTGIDGNPESIAYAKSQYSKENIIKFEVKDIMDINFEIPDCDLIISSHFIYHFEDKALIQFINNIKSKKTKHIIFSELYRSKIAYVLFKFSSFILPISAIAKKDGLLAIKRAFTIRELRSIFNNSDVKNFRIYKKIWFRTIVKIDL